MEFPAEKCLIQWTDDLGVHDLFVPVFDDGSFERQRVYLTEWVRLAAVGAWRLVAAPWPLPDATPEGPPETPVGVPITIEVCRPLPSD